MWLTSRPQLLHMVAVALEIVEEMMHHLMCTFSPDCNLMGSNVAKLLKRRQKLRDQSQTHYDTTIVGDVCQTSFNELLSNKLFSVKA